MAENTVKHPAHHEDDQLARLSRGKARSRAPIISGTRKLPSVVGIEGIRKKNTMMMPCMVNKLVVCFRLEQVPLRGQQLEPDHHGEVRRPGKRKNVMA